ncbi:glutamine synthetase-like [Oppia nitens]|uniref:glutamine synthetase-like n=1 Tax=Oppia nitens TaxID=1686743 RepID=UPI0023D9C74A|nr:glutamine synthetase-like [Oppia nitens]
MALNNISKVGLVSNQNFLVKYLSLEQPIDKTLVTYVYQHPAHLDTSNGKYKPQMCAKTRVLDFIPTDANQLPDWNSGCLDSLEKEIYLKPVRLYRDPFKGGNNKLVLCETYTDEMEPHVINHRYSCNKAMELARDHKPWFGFEQEYLLLDANDNQPLGWPKGGFPKPITDKEVLYYDGVGANRVYGRDVYEAHIRACIYAGVMITGQNPEAVPSQWEYQIGPCEGIRIGDDVMMSRYILFRVAEDLYIGVTLDPKPVPGWLGSGGHMNFSTVGMRGKGGIQEIEEAMIKLSKRHEHHIKVYDPHEGRDNDRRLGGLYASKSNEFTYGVGNRTASVRIPKLVARNGCGFFEDRRPAANCDPYQVSEALVRTCCLNE